MGDAELSTSARLRQVQVDLAASQADLTRVERERDELAFRVRELQAHRQLRDAELTSARAELEQLRARLNAPCGTCHPCDHYGRNTDLVAQLRRLAAENRAEVAHLAGTSSPLGFGPNRAAMAYDHAAELLEQTLGGEGRG
jgi:hypothetical protein